MNPFEKVGAATQWKNGGKTWRPNLFRTHRGWPGGLLSLSLRPWQNFILMALSIRQAVLRCSLVLFLAKATMVVWDQGCFGKINFHIKKWWTIDEKRCIRLYSAFRLFCLWDAIGTELLANTLWQRQMRYQTYDDVYHDFHWKKTLSLWYWMARWRMCMKWTFVGFYVRLYDSACAFTSYREVIWIKSTVYTFTYVYLYRCINIYT